MRPQDYRDVAFHEAAHAVADVRFGFGFCTVSIKPANGTLGRVFSLDGWDDLETARNYVISCLAGFASETRVDPTSEKLARSGACGDFEIVSKPLEVLMLDLETGIVLAKEWVDSPENWRAIELVANELLIRKELDADEVSTLVEIADGKATQKDLANMRESLAKIKQIQ